MRRILYGLAAGAAAPLALATISWTLPATLTLTDEHGAPASGAYVRYHYKGDLLNFAHPVQYVARGSAIVRADADGRVRIPFRFHVRAPFPLSTPPAHFIDDVYVPGLHNAFGPVAPLTTGHPGVFLIDQGAGHVTAFDVSGDPERWNQSLRNLYGCIRGTVDGPVAAGAEQEATAAHVRELIAHLRREYQGLLDAHGHRHRTRPPAPDGLSAAERQAWRDQMDAQLAREPLWGPYLERTWRGELKELTRLEALAK
jgi:hypothetical protein